MYVITRPRTASIFPPTQDIDCFVIVREYGSSTYEVKFPDGDSYVLDTNRLEMYLKIIGFDEEESFSIVSLAWNFYAVLCDGRVKKCVAVPKGDVDLVLDFCRRFYALKRVGSVTDFVERELEVSQ